MAEVVDLTQWRAARLSPLAAEGLRLRAALMAQSNALGRVSHYLGRLAAATDNTRRFCADCDDACALDDIDEMERRRDVLAARMGGLMVELQSLRP
ncbi:MAG TPA: hypothetical protein VEH84_09275 [Alphaproteobacteria bacterium]|nr:hypothetical protein [Alphaproteobacteria bacterium]